MVFPSFEIATGFCVVAALLSFGCPSVVRRIAVGFFMLVWCGGCDLNCHWLPHGFPMGLAIRFVMVS